MLLGQLPLKQMNFLYQTVIVKNYLVSRSIVNLNLTIILKRKLKKLHVLVRITPYTCISKRKLLMNFFLKRNLAAAH